jgi:hypothetical protein
LFIIYFVLFKIIGSFRRRDILNINAIFGHIEPLYFGSGNHV